MLSSFPCTNSCLRFDMLPQCPDISAAPSGTTGSGKSDVCLYRVQVGALGAAFATGKPAGGSEGASPLTLGSNKVSCHAPTILKPLQTKRHFGASSSYSCLTAAQLVGCRSTAPTQDHSWWRSGAGTSSLLPSVGRQACFGHTEGTAGITGALLVAASLSRAAAPGIVNLRRLNPYVAAAVGDWLPSGGGRAARLPRQTTPLSTLQVGVICKHSFLLSICIINTSIVNVRQLSGRQR